MSTKFFLENIEIDENKTINPRNLLIIFKNITEISNFDFKNLENNCKNIILSMCQNNIKELNHFVMYMLNNQEIICIVSFKKNNISIRSNTLKLNFLIIEQEYENIEIEIYKKDLDEIIEIFIEDCKKDEFHLVKNPF